MRLFEGRVDILGQSVLLRPGLEFQPTVRTVVGVLNANTHFPGPTPDFLLPLAEMSWNGQFGQEFLSVIARLAPHSSERAAELAANDILSREATRGRRGATVRNLRFDLTGELEPSLWVLFGGALILLAISTTVAAALLVEIAEHRRQEFGILISLGCTPGRLLYRHLAEHSAITFLATAAAIGLSFALDVATANLAPSGGDLGVSQIPFGAYAVVGISIVVVVFLSGAVPTIRSTRASSVQSQSASHVTNRRTLDRFAISAVVATAFVLVAGAVAFGQTLLSVRSRALGFDARDVLVLAITPTDVTVGSDPSAQIPGDLPSVSSPWRPRLTGTSALVSLRSHRHIAALIQHLETYPGVLGVAGAGAVPLAGSTRTGMVTPSGAAEELAQPVRLQVVTPGYFTVLRIPLLAGRDLAAADRGTRRAVVSREFNRRFLNDSGVGTLFIREGLTYSTVGVVEDVLYDPTSRDAACFYVIDASIAHINYFVVRTRSLATALMPTIVGGLRSAYPGFQVTSARSMEDIVMESRRLEELRSQVSSGFAVAALVLAGMGLAVLLRRHVAQRRREIGVRLALGARASDISRMVLREATRCVVVGACTGAVAASLMLAFLSARIHGFKVPTAPVLASTALLLICVSLMAAVGPARQAAQIDPLRIIRD
jgi:hypothetical protein